MVIRLSSAVEELVARVKCVSIAPAAKRTPTRFIGQRGLPLNARGQTALDEGKLPTLARSADQGLDVAALVATRELDVMIRGGYLKLDDAWAKRFRRYADLQNQWDQKTVALFVGPVSAASRPRE